MRHRQKPGFSEKPGFFGVAAASRVGESLLHVVRTPRDRPCPIADPTGGRGADPAQRPAGCGVPQAAGAPARVGDGLPHRAYCPLRPANACGDQALVEAILARQPWMVGFTCYVWNIERTLWIAAQLKRRQPDVKIVFGGPEITADNAWVLEQESLDYAVLGEGEQTFVELLAALGGPSLPARSHSGTPAAARRSAAVAAHAAGAAR